MPNPKSQQQYVFVCLCYCLVLVGCMQQSWGDISQFKTQRTLSSTDITHDSTKDVKCRIGKNLQSFRSMHLFLHRCVVVCDGQLIAYRLSTQSVKSKSSCVVAVFFFFFFFSITTTAEALSGHGMSLRAPLESCLCDRCGQCRVPELRQVLLALATPQLLRLHRAEGFGACMPSFA